MTHEDLLIRLQQKSCGITPDDIFSGKFDQLLDRGLRVLTLCFDGSGRSRTVADKLTHNYQIPAVRLIGGIKNLKRNHELSDSIPYLQAIMNSCPTIAVILTREEISHHYSFLSSLRALKYPNSPTAISSIVTMENN